MEPATLEDVSTAVAKIAFDGVAVRQGFMDVRDLAPALLDLGGLCERANEIINGDRAKLSVQVKSDFKTGSFEITLQLLQSLGSQIKDILFGSHVQSAKYIAEWVGISGTAAVSVLKLYKWLRGKKLAPDATTVVDGGVSVTINNANINNTFIIDPRVLEIYNDPAARRRVEGSLRPLLSEGIDTFEVRENAEVLYTVNKDEAREAAEAIDDDVDLPEEEPPLVDSTYTIALQIRKIPFKDFNLTWNFSTGVQNISAVMKDQEFLEKHQAGETSFSVGDILTVQLRTRQWRSPTGDLRIAHEVLKVIDHTHRRAPRQARLNGS